MVNSQAGPAYFLAVPGSLGVVDFESGVPAEVTITGGSTTNNSGGEALCNFNTTAGGGFFRSVSGGTVLFGLADPVDAFGFYVNGLQTDLVPQQTIPYIDGSSVSQIIKFPTFTGGGAIVGFVDYGQLIASVTFDATNDILAFDDLQFGHSATNPDTPVPATLALFGLEQQRRQQSQLALDDFVTQFCRQHCRKGCKRLCLQAA